ncbi:MAG TPA: HK97 gp10 family phage protein [Candidatus Bathyarchaeia archaeon]|nr:HK97 gp10 family phage protein [Candidatus Bathyarchaeia archaeon]
MAKWGKFDFSDFEKITQAFQKSLDERAIDRFLRDFLMEMAMRAMRKVKKRTPVGETGELRRNWQIGSIVKRGDSYQVELFNNTHYASFVEYGHRTGKDLTKWVEGRFMLTISMQEIERELPKYLDRRMAELLDNIMNGRPPRKE